MTLIHRFGTRADTRFDPAFDHSRRRVLNAAGGLGAAALLTPWTGAFAAGEYPSKAVRVIVPYAAGGSADTLGRLACQHLTVAMKQPFVTDNKSGAGGAIGSLAAAKAAPDGYTLVVSGIGSHVIAPAVSPTGYDPMKDFTHIASLGGPPTVLAVNVASGITDLKSFIAYVRAKPEGVSWGSPGQGTHGNLIGERFAQVAKVNLVHIAYRGAAPAVTDLVGNQIPAAFITYTSVNAHIKSGKVRALAITSAQRRPDLPDVPTFAELGFPDLTATTWFSISGPAGLPKPMVDRLNLEIRAGLKTKEALAQMALEGIEAPDYDATQFTAFVQSEIDRWTPLVKGLDKPKA
jgi:tripartite-type tricarboxylate transporter receptor subunit TctC